MERRRVAPVAAGAVAIVVLVVVASSIASLKTPDRSTEAGTSASAAAVTDGAPAIAGFAPGDGVPAADPIPWTDVTWDPLPTTGIETRPGQGVRGLVHAGELLVAEGRANDPRPLDNPNGLDDVAVVWLSRDGANWDISPILAGVPPNSVSEVTAIAAGPLGLVASGGVCCKVEAPAIWWSADGGSWELSAVAGLARGSYVQGLAAGPDGFVAIGVVGERGAIWTSADGRTWSEVDPGEAGLVRGYLWSVATTETGFLVVGQDDPGIENADAAVWASVGLDAWSRVAADDPSFAGNDEANLGLVVPFSGGFFAVGGTGTTKERKQCEQLLGGVHLATLSDTALSCGWMREMTWHSRDGEAWTRADPFGADGVYPPDFVGPPPGRAAVSWTHIVAGGPGLVALQDEISRIEDAANTIGVWTSADGATWDRVADTPFAGADYPVGFAVDGRRLFVITERGNGFIGTVRP